MCSPENWCCSPSPQLLARKEHQAWWAQALRYPNVAVWVEWGGGREELFRWGWSKEIWWSWLQSSDEYVPKTAARRWEAVRMKAANIYQQLWIKGKEVACYMRRAVVHSPEKWARWACFGRIHFIIRTEPGLVLPGQDNTAWQCFCWVTASRDARSAPAIFIWPFWNLLGNLIMVFSAICQTEKTGF